MVHENVYRCLKDEYVCALTLRNKFNKSQLTSPYDVCGLILQKIPDTSCELIFCILKIPLYPPKVM